MPATRRAYSMWLRFLLYLAIPGIACSVFDFGVNGSVLATVKRNVDGTSLRAIVQMRQSNESDHGGELPSEALTDVFAFATYLARAEVNEPRVWFSQVDPFLQKVEKLPTSILVPGHPSSGLAVDPDFRRLPLAWAVALVPSISKLPADTPVAWTRGLRPDGRWRADSLYPDKGGFIAFADTHVVFCRYSVAGKFHRWGTNEPTNNIAEALPPGTRIGENNPGIGDAVGATLNRQNHLGALVMTVSSLLLLGSCYLASRPRSTDLVGAGCTLVSLFCSFAFWSGVFQLNHYGN